MQGSVARGAPVVLLALLAFAVFAPHLHGAFVWDDTFLLQTNPAVVPPGDLHHLLTSPMEVGATVYRPLTMATFWLQAQMTGMSVAWFRIVNLALHIGCGLCLLGELRRRTVAPVGSVIATGVFLVHPSVTEAVQWLNGRHDLLGALLALIALRCRRSTRPVIRPVAVTTLTLLAMLCKEVFVVLPVILLLDTLGDCTIVHRRPTREEIAEVCGATFAVCAALALRHALHIGSGDGLVGTPVAMLVRGVLGVLRHDLLQIVTFTQGPTVETFRIPRVGRAVATAIVLTIVTVTLGAIAVRRRSTRASLALFGLAWAVLFLVPAAVAILVTGQYANRYAYLPCIGMAMVLAAGLDAVCVRFPSWGTMAVGLSGAMLCVGLAVRTAAAAADWHDEETLFRAAVERAPTDGRALYHLAVTRQRTEGCSTTLPMFVRATELSPRYDRAWHNVTGCLLQAGRYTDALVPARRAESLAPWNARNAYNLAVALSHTGQTDAARPWLLRAVALDPTYAPARDALRENAATP